MSGSSVRLCHSPIRWTEIVFFLCVLTPGAVLANPAREMDRGLIARIRRAGKNEKVVLSNVILSDTETRTIELEEFSVYSPDASILVYDSDPPRRIKPPARRYFKGRIVNEPLATVFFSVSTNSSDVNGLVVIGQKEFTIARGRRLPRKDAVKAGDDGPVLVAERDPVAENFEGPPFECGTENMTVPVGQLALHPKPVPLAVNGVSYQFRIAVESDNEFYAGFGSPSAATDDLINVYIGDLVAKASVIYMRDLNTTLNIGQVNIRPTNSPDPFVFTDTTDGFRLLKALGELGTVWHDNAALAAVVRSAVVMVSGRPLGGGVAHTNSLCRLDYPCGDLCFQNWGGAYAFNAAVGERRVPDPNATVNGIVYGLPADYWMLQSVAHELGHVVGSSHTHCVALSPAEQTQYNVTRSFVDECFSGSEVGCFRSTASVPPSVPPEKGTIMSYCYLSNSASGYPESRYLLGEAGKPSEKMLALLQIGLDRATPIGDITVGSNLPCTAGQMASVGNCGTGCSYLWTVAGGSIQGSAATLSISFTPNSPNVTVTATVGSAKECKVTTSFATTSQCVGLPPPVNLVATAVAATPPSVNLSWTAVAGAASYEVQRSANAIAYVTVGTPAGNAFTDSSAVADSSFLYRVAARDAGAITGPYGAPDLATTVIFTDEPLIAGSTAVKTLHMNQLRTAVNAMRTLARLGTATFTDSIGPLVQVRKIHIDELRTNLDASRAALGLLALSYTDPSVTAASTTIKAAHFGELRNGVK